MSLWAKIKAHPIRVALSLLAVVAVVGWVSVSLKRKSWNPFVRSWWKAADQPSDVSPVPAMKETMANPPARQLAGAVSCTDGVCSGSPYDASRSSAYSGDWWAAPLDANDVGNVAVNGGSCGSDMPAGAVEPFHPHSGAHTSAMTKSGTYLSDPSFPDELAPNSLAVNGNQRSGQQCDGSADVMTDSNKFAMNAENLLPGSWRSGTACAANQEDPVDAQWTKYHPTRERYQRFITSAGSVRMGIQSRSPHSKVMGLPNMLRSGTATPLTNTPVMFGDSSHRLHAIQEATGMFPGFHNSTC